MLIGLLPVPLRQLTDRPVEINIQPLGQVDGVPVVVEPAQPRQVPGHLPRRQPRPQPDITRQVAGPGMHRDAVPPGPSSPGNQQGAACGQRRSGDQFGGQVQDDLRSRPVGRASAPRRTSRAHHATARQ
jgi:hypothetical protein